MSTLCHTFTPSPQTAAHRATPAPPAPPGPRFTVTPPWTGPKIFTGVGVSHSASVLENILKIKSHTHMHTHTEWGECSSGDRVFAPVVADLIPDQLKSP